MDWNERKEVIPNFDRKSLENAHLASNRLHHWGWRYYERCEDPKWTERASSLSSRGLCCHRWWLFIFRYLGLVCSYCYYFYYYQLGARGGAAVWGTALQAGRSRVRFPMVSLGFLIDINLPAELWPGVDSTSNRKDYQEYFRLSWNLGASTSWNPQGCPDLSWDCLIFACYYQYFNTIITTTTTTTITTITIIILLLERYRFSHPSYRVFKMFSSYFNNLLRDNSDTCKFLQIFLYLKKTMDYVYRTFIYHIATLYAIMTEKIWGVGERNFWLVCGRNWCVEVHYRVPCSGELKAHERFELINI